MSEGKQETGDEGVHNSFVEVDKDRLDKDEQ